MKPTGFPENFLWGAASAAAQIEGGWNDGGRTPSIWDAAPKSKIKHGEDCHTACDHYHRWREDVALMKELGLKSYRFSISWSRVIPSEGKVNEEGLRFYSDLVDALIAVGIEPLVTIFHWDMPLWVYEKGGWLSESIVPLFRDYTRVVVEALSDRVTWWMTINEPGCFIMNGYLQGVHAPFKRDYLALSKLTRNCMLAHAAAVKAIRQYAKKPPKVGVAFSSSAYVPKSEEKADVETARKKSVETSNGLMANRWWMDPMILGKPVRAYGVYGSRQKDMAEIAQPLDFMGLNIYSSMNYGDWGDTERAPAETPRNSLGWVIDGRVMYWNVKFIYERYHLPIMITENGLAANDAVSLDGAVHDPNRTDFIRRYLGQLKRAVAEGIPVLGYQHWSIMDNFEWAEGYGPRFGLVYVDYATQKRIVKDSAWEYKKIIETNGAYLL
ncbi:MAG: family 1 glycosylhydrolase [Oscillospiraceae bacterium]|nr:family 1 glycosylhydrolase [Oscillospiraceae bacterium]